MKSHKKLVTFGALLCVLASVFCIADEREEEIQGLIEIYTTGDLTTQKKRTEALAWQGIQDERVYDQIEKNLLALYPTIVIEQGKYPSKEIRNKEDSTAWLAKGLGFSGNEKYKPTLERVAQEVESYKIRSHANDAIIDIAQYKIWNNIINDPKDFNADSTLVANRYANMVRSDDLYLKQLAAKRIYNEKIIDEYLLDLVNAEVLAHYRDKNKDKSFAVTYGFFCKAMAATGIEKYKPTIKEVALDSHNIRLKNYARKYIKSYSL